MAIDAAELASQIGAAKERYWQIGGEPRAWLRVAMSTDNATRLLKMVGRVNREGFCGAEPERLLFYSFEIGVENTADFILNLIQSWNEWLTVDGSFARWEPTLYEQSDFAAI